MSGVSRVGRRLRCEAACGRTSRPRPEASAGRTGRDASTHVVDDATGDEHLHGSSIEPGVSTCPKVVAAASSSQISRPLWMDPFSRALDRDRVKPASRYVVLVHMRGLPPAPVHSKRVGAVRATSVIGCWLDDDPGE